MPGGLPKRPDSRRQGAVATAGDGVSLETRSLDSGQAGYGRLKGKEGCVKTRFLQNEANVFEALRSCNEFIC